jgi:nucleotide-binding universal stress UspA family protein
VEAETALYNGYFTEIGIVIAEAVRDRQADLVVMSTHGRGGLGRWIYGSVADQVLRTSDVPVLLISAADERPWPGQAPFRIVVPLDGSSVAEEALDPVVELAKALEGELVLLRVVEPPNYGLELGESPKFSFQPDVELAVAKEYLAQVADRLTQTGSAVESRAVVGSAPETIASIAREENAHLIAMATHGRSGLARVVLGSVATGTLQRASLPMLLVRPGVVRRAVAEPAAPRVEREPLPEDLTTVALSPRDLNLLQRGLGELLFAQTTDHTLAEEVRQLLARLREASAALGAGSAGPGESPPQRER